MLFKARFHAGLRDGSICESFRSWARPQVRVGGRYRLGDGEIVVEAVRPVRLGSLGDRDARRAGFADAEELVAFLRSSSSKRLDARSRLFRVRFHYSAGRADPLPALRSETSAKALDELAARLERMDRLSRRGPWTRDVLRLIAQRPRTAAARLARELGLETQPFKADVRKLKRLGLTVSHETGYELSPRGRALLRRDGVAPM